MCDSRDDPPQVIKCSKESPTKYATTSIYKRKEKISYMSASISSYVMYMVVNEAFKKLNYKKTIIVFWQKITLFSMLHS